MTTIGMMVNGILKFKNPLDDRRPYGYHRGAATALSGSQQADFGGFRNFTETPGSRNTVPETVKS